MPPTPTTKDTIYAVNDKEQQLAPRRSARVQERKEPETGTVNAAFAALPPPLEEEKKEPLPPEEKKKQPGLPRCIAITMPTCQIRQV
jgi:hypothetical protein